MSLPSFLSAIKKDRGQKPRSARGHRCYDEDVLRSSTDPIWADYGKGHLRQSAAYPAAPRRSCGSSCTYVYPRITPTRVGTTPLWGKHFFPLQAYASSPTLSSERWLAGWLAVVTNRDEQHGASAALSGS